MNGARGWETTVKIGMLGGDDDDQRWWFVLVVFQKSQ